MSSSDIAGILDTGEELDQLKKELDEIQFQINKMHKKLLHTPEVVERPGDKSLLTLKMLYSQALELSKHEMTLSFQMLRQLDALLHLETSGQHQRRMSGEQKRKRMKTDSDGFRSSPSMRSHLESLANLKGEEVAARVSQDDADKDEWFVVKVIHFNKETREFEVLDEEPGDDEDSYEQRKYKLPMSRIIPFPKEELINSVSDFPPGRRVLAVYPHTTALYGATVVGRKRKSSADQYILEFDDDEEEEYEYLPQRLVPSHRVVPLPEGYRQ